MNIYQIIRKESFIETIKICEDDNIFVSKTYKEQVPNYEINKFEENAQALSKINYPSILYINKYDINIINNKATLQIISKYLPNGSLNNLFETRSKILWNDTDNYITILGIALGMNYLHSQNIIHGNLKPSNILFDNNLYPQICDIDLFTKSSKQNDVSSFIEIVYEIITNKRPPIQIENIHNYDCQTFFERCISKEENLVPTFSEILDFFSQKSFRQLFNQIELPKIIKYLNFFEDIHDGDSYFIHGCLLNPSDGVYLFRTGANLGSSNSTLYYAFYLLSQKKIEESVQYFKSEIEKGNGNAMFAYYKILNTNGQTEEANKFIIKAAEKGNPKACAHLAIILKSQKKYEEAARLLKLAADKGHVVSMFNYAYMLEKGIGIERNIKEATKYYKKSIDRGYLNALNNYAFIIKNNPNDDDKKSAVQYFKECIDKCNNPYAMCNYAYMCQVGHGIDANQEMAEYYYKESINRGVTDAMNQYGRMLELRNNIKEAARLYEMSAEKGDIDGMNNLISLIIKENKIEISNDKLLMYCKKAANEGRIFSMLYLASLPYIDENAPINKEEAKNILKIAVDKKSSEAKLHLGYIKESEANENVDEIKEAAKYYQEAADKGIVKALDYYVHITKKYQNIFPSNDELYKYYYRAADNGNIFAMYKIGCDHLSHLRFFLAGKFFWMGIKKGANIRGNQFSTPTTNTEMMNELISKYINLIKTYKIKPMSYFEEENTAFFKMLALKGDPYAICIYCLRLKDGIGIEKNENEAFEIIKEEVEKEQSFAITYYARFLELGIGTQVNLEKAEIYYKKALKVDKGAVSKYYCALFLLSNRSNHSKAKYKAMKYLNKAADKGFPEAMFLYAQELEKTYREGNKDDFLKICKYYVNYINDLGYENIELLYRYALFLEKDPSYKLISLKYYQIAAHNGHIKAMASYARILYETNPKNLRGAMLYYKRAANEGDIESMYKYGSLLVKNGDIKTAAEYLKKASTENIEAEKLFLELVVEEKYKVENQIEFVNYTKRAAELHINVGMYKYGLMLIKGDNVPKNHNEGMKYIKEAAELGNIDAMSKYTCDILSNKGITKYGFDHFYEESRKYEKILYDYKSDNSKVFVDENFPHFSNWKRIDEIYDVPLFQEDLISPNYTNQGYIGDCYFISFLSRVAKQPYLVSKLFETALPNKILGKVQNSINIKCGAVVVYFQAFGVQTPVLIDTYIPVSGNTPTFSRPSDNTKSPWFCLVEKAFAKLNGSFSNIVSGNPSFSIYSMFFYYSKKIDLSAMKSSNSDMFNKIMKYQKKGYLISASIKPKCNIENTNLIENHSYFLFRADEIKDEKLICLRNPWGHCEFKGKYSKNSLFWTDELKEKLNFNQYQNGSFFMTDEEFFSYFKNFDILKPIHPTWKIKSFHCQFVPGSNDGVQINDRIEFFDKTQKFVFKITDEIPPNEKCRLHVVIEKKKSTFQDQINEERNINYSLHFGHVKCQNYESIRDNINNMSLKRISSIQINDSFSYEIDEDNKNDIIILFLNRLSKQSFIEDCYVSVFCKYNFRLYNFDCPENDFKNIPNPGISFHNFTISHPTIANPLLIRFLDDKFVFDFGTLLNGDRIIKEDFSTFFKYANQKVGSSHINLDDFELTPTLIGNGTNGQVYIVKEKKTGKQYAAKIYNYGIARTKGFFRELTVFRSVKYPSLVKFRGFSERNFNKIEFPVLITEYLKKGCLYNILVKLNDPLFHNKVKEEWTATKQMISIIGIALGMDYLHHRNIIHRDLKLHNILLDDNLYPKICDFGDSKLLEIEQSSNKTYLVGTPLFMAPEILNHNNSYSYPVDVYSFGVICYFIYNQEVPYDQTNPIDFSSPKNKFTNFISLLTNKDPNQRPSFSKIIEMLLSDREGTWIDGSNEKEIELYINRFGLSIKPKIQQINIDTLLFIHEEKYPIDARKPKRTVEQMINDYEFPDSVKNDLIFAEDYIRSKALINTEIADKGQIFYFLGTVFCGDNKITGDIVEKDLYYAIRYLVIALRFKIYRSSYLLACIFANDTKPESQEIAYIAAKIAANFGCNEAFPLLGYFFYRGIGIPFNIVMAAIYFKIAADEGDVDSMVNYAKILLNVGNHELKLKDLKQQIKEAEIIIQKMGNIKDCIFNKTRLTIEALEDEDVALYVSRKYFEKASSQGNKEATEKLLMINQNNAKFDDDHPQYFDDFTQ